MAVVESRVVAMLMEKHEVYLLISAADLSRDDMVLVHAFPFQGCSALRAYPFLLVP